MAKFETYVNVARLAIVIASVGNVIYQHHKVARLHKDKREAERYLQIVNARLDSMHEYMWQNRASKATYKEAMEAARNRLAFEVRDELDGNRYLHETFTKINKSIDVRISKII